MGVLAVGVSVPSKARILSDPVELGLQTVASHLSGPPNKIVFKSKAPAIGTQNRLIDHIHYFLKDAVKGFSEEIGLFTSFCQH